MASIGNTNIINDFKNALKIDHDTYKKEFSKLSMDEQLHISSLKQKIKIDTSRYDDNDYSLMMKYTNNVDESNSDSDLSESDEENVKKRKAKGFTKKRKSYGIKKQKAKKSKKQRKIKKKSKTFRRFA
jgi:hypothetical protein